MSNDGESGIEERTRSRVANLLAAIELPARRQELRGIVSRRWLRPLGVASAALVENFLVETPEAADALERQLKDSSGAGDRATHRAAVDEIRAQLMTRVELWHARRVGPIAATDLLDGLAEYLALVERRSVGIRRDMGDSPEHDETSEDGVAFAPEHAETSQDGMSH